MRSGVSGLRFKKERGRMVVQTLGRTARGQRYIKETIEIEAAGPGDPKFKGELSAAVIQLLRTPGDAG